MFNRLKRENEMTAELIARIEKGEGRDTVLEAVIAAQFGFPNVPGNFTVSLDAAIALVEKVLPGWGYRIETTPHTQRRFAIVWTHKPKYRREKAHANSAPRALLAAMLSAFAQESK